MNNSFLDLSNLGKNGALRWIGGILLILFFWQIIGGFLAVPFLFWANYLKTNDVLQSFIEMADLTFGDPLWTYIGVNVSFFGIWVGLWLAVRFIHQRAFRTLITPAPKINWTRLAQGFGVWFALVAIFQIAEFVIYPSRAVITFDAGQWLIFLPLILIFTPIQTSAEELLFRGYFLQGTGRLTKNFIVLAIVNGILFGLPHMLNPEVLQNPSSTLLLFLNYFLTGAAFAWYTLHDNRLELVLGAHLANNLFAALFVNYAGSALTTPAVFTNPILDANFGLFTLIVTTAVFYFILLRTRALPASS